MPALTSCCRRRTSDVNRQPLQKWDVSNKQTAHLLGTSVFLIYEDCCLARHDAAWSVRIAKKSGWILLPPFSGWMTILFIRWKQQDRIIRHQLYHTTRRHVFGDTAQIQSFSSPKTPNVTFWARLQNCEKRLPASSCLSVRMEHLGSHSTDFSWNLIFEEFFF